MKSLLTTLTLFSISLMANATPLDCTSKLDRALLRNIFESRLQTKLKPYVMDIKGIDADIFKFYGTFIGVTAFVVESSRVTWAYHGPQDLHARGKQYQEIASELQQRAAKNTELFKRGFLTKAEFNAQMAALNSKAWSIVPEGTAIAQEMNAVTRIAWRNIGIGAATGALIMLIPVIVDALYNSAHEPPELAVKTEPSLLFKLYATDSLGPCNLYNSYGSEYLKRLETKALDGLNVPLFVEVAKNTHKATAGETTWKGHPAVSKCIYSDQP